MTPVGIAPPRFLMVKAEFPAPSQAPDTVILGATAIGAACTVWATAGKKEVSSANNKAKCRRRVCFLNGLRVDIDKLYKAVGVGWQRY